MYKFIDADYYGFRDEEDGVLAQVEGPAEAAMRAEARPISLHIHTRLLSCCIMTNHVVCD